MAMEIIDTVNPVRDTVKNRRYRRRVMAVRNDQRLFAQKENRLAQRKAMPLAGMGWIVKSSTSAVTRPR